MKKTISIILIMTIIIGIMPVDYAKGFVHANLGIPKMSRSHNATGIVNSLEPNKLDATLTSKYIPLYHGVHDWFDLHMSYTVPFTVPEDGDYALWHSIFITTHGLFSNQDKPVSYTVSIESPVDVGFSAYTYSATSASKSINTEVKLRANIGYVMYLRVDTNLNLLHTQNVLFQWHISKEPEPEPDLLDLIYSHTDNTGTYYMLQDWTAPKNIERNYTRGHRYFWTERVNTNKYRAPETGSLRYRLEFNKMSHLSDMVSIGFPVGTAPRQDYTPTGTWATRIRHGADPFVENTTGGERLQTEALTMRTYSLQNGLYLTTARTRTKGGLIDETVISGNTYKKR